MFSSNNSGANRLLLTVEETASALNLGRSKVYDLISKGELPSIKIHGSRRVPVDLLNSWINDQVLATQGSGGRYHGCP